LPDSTIILTANSTSTLSSSSADTQKKVLSAIERLGENDPNTTKVPSTGHYISRIDDWRVVWTRQDQDNRILVLTIFAPST
jgi:mRNA-degrading endonuclease RelE of RelBE toxin-antitoxin system